MQPRINICIPSMSTWCANTAMAHSELCIYSTLQGIPVRTSNIQCSLVTSARNALVRGVLSLEPQATHILFLDSDMLFPFNGLERLLAHDKDVVGAFYNKRVPPYQTVGHLIGNPDISAGGLYRADVMPHGFVLIKREVYEKLRSPWYYESYDPNMASDSDPDGLVGEDVNFSRDCTKNGIEMWCDADLTFECAHIGEVAVPCLRPEPRTKEAV
jgi:hypothetical protein